MNNRGFLEVLADCSHQQLQLLVRTATPRQMLALIQVIYNILMENIPCPEKKNDNEDAYGSDSESKMKCKLHVIIAKVQMYLELRS